MNLKNQLKTLIVDKVASNFYNQRAFVRKKYTVDQKIIENRVEEKGVEDSVVRDADSDKYDEIIDIINANYSKFYERNTNHGVPVVVSSEIMIPKVIDKNTFKISDLIDTGKCGVYDGIEAYSYNTELGNTSTFGFYAPRITFNYVKRTIENYLLNWNALRGVDKVMSIYKNIQDPTKIRPVIDKYISDIQLGVKLLNDNFDTLELLLEDSSGVSRKYDPNIDSKSTYNAGKALLKKFIIRMTKIYAEQVVILNSKQTPVKVQKPITYSTTDVFEENNLTIEFTNEGFEYFRENLFNLSFNAKSNPSPDGRSVVKIPKENSFIFATPLRNAEYFVAQAVEYDTVQITIDENLSMRIKDFLVNIKTDYAYLNTGVQENQGINIERTELFTGLVEKIRLESSQGNHFIELYNKNIVIDGKSGKIGIGLIGDGELKTPYDNDILTLTERKDKINQVFDDFTKRISVVKSETTRMFKDSIGIANLAIALLEYNKDFSINLKTLAEIDDFKNELFDKAKKAKTIVTNESFDKRLSAKEWSKPDFTKFNNVKDDIKNLTNESIADFIMQLPIGAATPMRDKAKKQLRSDREDAMWKNSQSPLYVTFYNDLIGRGLIEYVNIFKQLTDSNSFGFTTEKETFTDQGYNYVSPQEGVTIIGLYILCEYIAYNATLKNLLKLQSDYRLNNKTTYKESLGSILKDMTNILKGSIKSFTGTPGNPPVLQTTGAEETFDNKMEEFNTRISDFLL